MVKKNAFLITAKEEVRRNKEPDKRKTLQWGHGLHGHLFKDYISGSGKNHRQNKASGNGKGIKYIMNY